jgi:hypothetical protein
MHPERSTMSASQFLSKQQIRSRAFEDAAKALEELLHLSTANPEAKSLLTLGVDLIHTLARIETGKSPLVHSRETSLPDAG